MFPLIIKNNQGSALIIALLTLALLSLIGVSATTTSKTEIEITANDKAYKQAFYAAELALTTGENELEGLENRLALDEANTPGHYAEGAQPAWGTMAWNSTDSAEVPSADIPQGLNGIPTSPRYAVEQRIFIRDSLTTGIGVPTGRYLFNVSSEGTGGADNAKVILQTIYAKRYD